MERLNWGLIGGGEGSQIGPVHRLAARIDGHFDFCAGALDADAAAGRAFAMSLGVPKDRAYGDWRDMLAGERDRRRARAGTDDDPADAGSSKLLRDRRG